MDLGGNTVQISSLSTMFLIVPVQVTQSGEPYDPTNDVIQFSFVQNFGSNPSPLSWVFGTWSVYQNYNYPYAAKCLIGPAITDVSGGATLNVGTYNIWLRIFDNPEVPVFQAGMLQIV